MIIPTSEFDPMFARDEVPFSEKMGHYIQREFADILGPNARLLETADGLEKLRHIYSGDCSANESQRKAA